MTTCLNYLVLRKVFSLEVDFRLNDIQDESFNFNFFENKRFFWKEGVQFDLSVLLVSFWKAAFHDEWKSLLKAYAVITAA